MVFLVLLMVSCVICNVVSGASVGTVLGDDDIGHLCDRTVDIAIVGAGPSGTYSAYLLRQSGLDVELFEYSNRIGGRLLTKTLPNIPDLNLELGGMRYVNEIHPRVKKLVDELGLTPTEFTEGFGKPGRTRYYVRGQSLTYEDLRSGDIPFDLTPEEKANQHRLFPYYLELLTGFNESYLAPEQVLELKTFDGTPLYQLTIEEALDMVASPEGKKFARALNVFESDITGDTSAVNVFNLELGEYSHGGTFYTLKEGMSSIPQGLAQAFTDAGDSNKITLNRKLNLIENNPQGGYSLYFRRTKTKNGITKTVRGSTEVVCASQVVLAMPQYALQRLNWRPLRSRKIKDALNAVYAVKANKIFMTFKDQWWIADAENPSYVAKSTLIFEQLYDWKQSQVSGEYAMIASYTDGSRSGFEEDLNNMGERFPGSPKGANQVSIRLKDEILRELENVYGIDTVPEPTAAISQFWTTYPFGGGWTSWRAGYHFDDVWATLRHPSTNDDVFIVGADLSFGHRTPWIEGALETVESVITSFF